MKTSGRLMTVLDWMALAILVAVVLLSARVLAADGGTDAPRVLSVRSALLQLDDGGVAFVDGGAWLNDAATLDAARDKVRAETLTKALREAPPEPPGVPPTPFAIAVAAAAAVAFALGRLTR